MRHLRQPVRFAEGLATLVGERSLTNIALLEVGPGRTLTSLAQAHPNVGPGRTIVPSLRHAQDPVSDRDMLVTAVGRLWATGIEPNWEALLGAGRRRVSLPTYAFDHERHWIEPGNGFFLRPETARTLEKTGRSRAVDLSARLAAARAADTALLPAARNILVFEDREGVGRELVLELQAAGHSVVIARQGDRFSRVNESAFQLRPDSRDDHGALLRELGACRPDAVADRSPVGCRRRRARRCEP